MNANTDFEGPAFTKFNV